MVLPSQTIKILLQQNPPLVEGLLDMEEQLQANGLDLTLRQISVVSGAGRIATGKQRALSHTTPVSFNNDNWVYLRPGTYLVTYNEIIRLPADIMAIGQPRSSVLRCGVSISTAVWDAGYHGRSQSLLVVHNPAGFEIKRNARIMQLVFFRLESRTEKIYDGLFQNENI